MTYLKYILIIAGYYFILSIWQYAFAGNYIQGSDITKCRNGQTYSIYNYKCSDCFEIDNKFDCEYYDPIYDGELNPLRLQINAGLKQAKEDQQAQDAIDQANKDQQTGEALTAIKNADAIIDREELTEDMKTLLKNMIKYQLRNVKD